MSHEAVIDASPHLPADSSEEQIIQIAQSAVSQCNWVVGECAAEWTKRYARGRTDADFAVLVGLSPDQVFQRRRVWETFGGARERYGGLKWSHFYVALTWDDAPECLAWAEENQTTVQEMRVWRRALRGEDLEEEIDRQEWGSPGVVNIDETPVPVTMPGDPPSEETGPAVKTDSESNVVAYAPFRKDAMTPAPSESDSASATPVGTQEELEKLIRSLERINRRLSPELAAAAKSLPADELERLVEAVTEIHEKLSAAIEMAG